jgi:hypothetical protein
MYKEFQYNLQCSDNNKIVNKYKAPKKLLPRNPFFLRFTQNSSGTNNLYFYFKVDNMFIEVMGITIWKPAKFVGRFCFWYLWAILFELGLSAEMGDLYMAQSAGDFI